MNSHDFHALVCCSIPWLVLLLIITMISLDVIGNGNGGQFEHYITKLFH
ncbi:MAG: hypothetical protein OEY52_02965 [Gammaproteobacteria bacterium]|nr:hypothetical protein [Gammaproteobacteria bacterium]